MKPTHFIGMRIKDENIWKKMEILQNEIIKEYPEYEPFKINVKTLHLTLMVLHITEEQLKETKNILTDYILKSIVPLKPITLKSVGHFDEKILFMKLEDETNIKEYRQDMFEFFQKEKTCTILEVDRTFNPHGTLFNLFWSKDKNLKLDMKLLEKYNNYSFGEFKFNSIELNQMGSKNDYYNSEIKFMF
jgi:2'-5' RNA ligase